MDTTKLELELLELEEQYEKTRSNITKAELENKIALKKREIKNVGKQELTKNVIPSREVAARMDHGQDKNPSKVKVGSFNSFSIGLN